MLSSEDEGPCYVDSETAVDWIRTLSEQSSNGVITNSRKDLLNDCANSTETDSERENVPEKKEVRKKKKKKKQPATAEKEPVKMQPKIPTNVKKVAISSSSSYEL